MNKSRSAVVVGATTLTLLFGGAGIAGATETVAPAPATTTVLAQEADDDGGDNTGLWGLLGLLGLVGLAGLKRRNPNDHVVTQPGAVNPPPRA
ncbi:WGxxGxxG family protein [Mycolicibacterium vaccae]|uniref:WGxxGxxG family protein n=1 Tax=Mycolicibacterium vaccae TaxID=1810 RepID=UPI003CFEB86F